MAKEPELPSEPSFLLSPAELNQMQLIINIGPDVRLTPEVEAALDELMRHLSTREVQARLAGECDPLIACKPIKCSNLVIGKPPPTKAIS